MRYHGQRRRDAATCRCNYTELLSASTLVVIGLQKRFRCEGYRESRTSEVSLVSICVSAESSNVTISCYSRCTGVARCIPDYAESGCNW